MGTTWEEQQLNWCYKTVTDAANIDFQQSNQWNPLASAAIPSQYMNALHI